MNRILCSLILFGAIDLFALQSASAVTNQLSYVGDAGNANDPATGFGGVGYNYEIGTYDVTNSQYVEFLNAKDPTGANSLQLYNSPYMSDTQGGDLNYNPGAPTGSKYSVISGRGNFPMYVVTWYDAIRFDNWLNNGQGNGSTETGAYTLLGGTPTPSNANSITRNAGAKVFLPSLNEWYKAAYYDPSTSSYFEYPTSSNTAPTASGTMSPSGAFDMGGDYYQWTDTVAPNGGVAARGAGEAPSSDNYHYYPTADFAFRVAGTTMSVFWTGTINTLWANSGNWSGAIPGAAVGTNNTDTAVFNQNAPNSSLTLDAGRNIQNITFDTSSVNSLTIGTLGGNPLLLTAGGAIQMNSTVVNPQTFNCPLVLEGEDYRFVNLATNSSATLNSGGEIIPGAASGLTNLILTGSNAGANTIGGTLADNGAGQLAIVMSGTGSWTLGGANTYSGATTVARGTLGLAGGSTNNIPNSPTINVASGATLDVTGLVGSTFVLGAGNVPQTIAGGGTVNGSVTVSGGLANGSGNAPAASAISGGSAGTLTINGGLMLQNGSVSNFALGAPNGSGNSLAAFVNVTGAGGLNVNGIHIVNLSGTAQLGTYELYAFTSGTPLTTQFTIGTGATGVAAYSVVVVPNTEVDLIVSQVFAWDFNGNGNYSDSSKWYTGVVPSGAGNSVVFGNGVVNVVSSNIGVLVDGAEVVGALVFNNTNGSGYTLSRDNISGHGITLDNNGKGAVINVSATARQTINAWLTMADDLAFNINAGSWLLIGSNIYESGTGRILTMNGPGTLWLNGADTYSGGTVINSGTLNTTAGGTLGAGPLSINAASTTSTLNLNRSQMVSSVTSNGSGGGSAVVNVASGRTLVSMGALTSSGNLNLTGPGTTEIDGAPTLNANSVITVTNGILRFAATSGSPTIGTGVTVTVGAGATLELAGSVAALSSGTNRVNVSTLASSNGILVSGTHQQVGNIDGTGNTQVNAGSDLTANHIIQAALIISGASGNFGRVTIAASDASGNPLGQASAAPGSLLLANSLTSHSPFGDGMNPTSSFDGLSGSNAEIAGDSADGSNAGSARSAVPEPSTATLLALAFTAAYLALGDVHLRLGNVPSSRKDYQKCLEICRKLVQADARNADERADLARCYGRLAHLEESIEDFPAAHCLEQSVAILERLNIDQSPELRVSLQMQKELAAVCRSAPQTIESLEFAPAAPKDLVPMLLGIRSRTLARGGKSQDAAAAADKLAALALTDAGDLFHAATVFALGAEGVRAASPPAAPSSDAKGLEDRYAAQAVELFKNSQVAGYFEDMAHRAILEADHNLDSLRQRNDFKNLRSAVEQTNHNETTQ